MWSKYDLKYLNNKSLGSVEKCAATQEELDKEDVSESEKELSENGSKGNRKRMQKGKAKGILMFQNYIMV